ncbi:septum site-determining protein Ssd [Streptantibioticus parmotrematis]|uniref:septum site-determining protein Ssd n=1 Tax=Streptantibioticus parmotrematis TaxID=2873249 RepID=UPI0033E95706
MAAAQGGGGAEPDRTASRRIEPRRTEPAPLDGRGSHGEPSRLGAPHDPLAPRRGEPRHTLTTPDTAGAERGLHERRPGAPLIVTEDEELLDDLLRLCAAAGAEPEVSFGPPPYPGTWQAAPLVLVGDDCSAAVRRAQRRPGVLLIGRDLDDQDVWRRAVDIGADHVLFLPDAERWLVDRIADAAEGVGETALTVGVVGGRGGAGASTLACALAVTAARSGRRTMLVDGDPLGGGLDVLLGGERVSGLRWPDLAEAQGRVSGGALEESLPRLHDLSVLSWDRGDSVMIGADAMRSVLGAARRRGGVIVVDLPRRMDDAVVEALSQIDVGLLVVPAELRAVAAADRVASRVGMVLRDLRIVTRGPFPSGLDTAEIARLLRLPVAGELPPEKGLLEAVESGAPPGAAGRGPLARFSAAFLDDALRSRGGVTA